MKLQSVEFTESVRLPKVPSGPQITGLTGRIDADPWLLDLSGNGYVYVAHQSAPDAVTAYSPSIIRLVRVAPPEPEPKTPKKG